MDDPEEAEVVPNSNKLYRMILLSLCSNFNIYQDPQGEMDCHFKTPLQYEMMAMRGKTLRITTIEKPPLSGTMLDASGKLIGTGVAFTLLHEIQEKLGFKYDIILPDTNEIGNTTHGAIKLLYNNEVDMAVLFFPMLREYRKWLLFSQSLGELDWVLFMKRPLASATGSGLLAPFEMNVWLAILVSLVAIGPIIYYLITLRVRLCEEDRQVNRSYPLPSCIWFVYGALMKQGSTLSPISDSARILFATWWIFITILTSFYTANLTAFLTLSQFTLTIKGPSEIESFRRTWIAERDGVTYELINNDGEMAKLRAMIPQYGTFVSAPDAEIFQSVMKDVIYVSERRRATLLILEDYLTKTRANVTEQERCTFVLSKSFLTKPVAFAYPRDGNLSRIMNPLLESFIQGGIIDFLMNKPLPMTTICPLNLPSSERKLRNGDLIMTYSLVVAGFVLAAIVFVVEVFYRRYKSNHLSINSGDIQAAFSNQRFMSKKPFKDNVKMGSDLFYGRAEDNPFTGSQDRKAAPTFVFQYTH